MTNFLYLSTWVVIFVRVNVTLLRINSSTFFIVSMIFSILIARKRSRVNRIVWVETHSWMKSFIDEERKHLSKDVESIVVCKFRYEQSIDSIILHVITIFTKLTSYVLIDSLNLIICFEMKRREKFTFDV